MLVASYSHYRKIFQLSLEFMLENLCNGEHGDYPIVIRTGCYAAERRRNTRAA